MSLESEISERRSEVKSDAYPISIGELASLYQQEELNLYPDFQRFFRWTLRQKSRLIESLLLGIPIPSIFVTQRSDGKWDVIDGLQRLSTIFEAMGILKDRNGNALPPLVLESTQYLPSLGGKRWPHKGEEPEKNNLLISGEAQLLIKRSKLDVKIVLRESTASTKFELFQRLNTGGAFTSDQEVRNAMLLMASKDFFQWFETLSTDPNFVACTPLTDRAVEEQYRLELLTRFLVFRTAEESDYKDIADLKDFLDQRVVSLSQIDQKARALEEEAFRMTFSLLASDPGEDSFRRYNQDKKSFMGPFLISAFEAVGVGIGYHALSKDAKNLDSKELVKRIKKLWENKEFLNGIGSGVRASSRIPVTISLGRKLFAP